MVAKDITGKKFNRLTAVRFDHIGNHRKHYWLFRCECGRETIADKHSVIYGNIQSCGCKHRGKMPNDIKGKTFNYLTAIRFDHVNGKRKHYWLFRCKCGKEKVISKEGVKSGKIKSCGCRHKGKIPNNITGQKFNKLTAIRLDHIDRHKRHHWLFVCSCGNETIADKAFVVNGHTKSCGCLIVNSGIFRRNDITGKKYGRLTAIRFIEKINGRYFWLFNCDCGVKKILDKGSVTGGNSKSCGCLCAELRHLRSGINSPLYGKGGKYSSKYIDGRTPLVMLIRRGVKQKGWNGKVLKYNDFTCQKCHARGGRLHVHHIKSFSSIFTENNIKSMEDAEKCEELWDVKNGITFCKKCHNDFHKVYGIKNNTSKQVKCFLSN